MKKDSSKACDLHKQGKRGGMRFFARAALGLIVVLALAAGCLALVDDRDGADSAGRAGNTWAGPKSKYIFLFIGDGMGKNQVAVGKAYLEALHRNPGLPGGERYASSAPERFFANFSSQGSCSTYARRHALVPFGRKTTDSAAAGTALATGFKTRKLVVSMDAGKKKPLKTIAEEAKERGMKVGVLSSVSINHATPAVFYAHASSRNRLYDIGRQLPGSGFDYFGGGGFDKADYKGRPNLYGLAEKEGYALLRDKEAILSAGPQMGRVYAISPALDKDSAMPDAITLADSDLTLADFTRKGIELLDNPSGFFMMVEGGKIDWASHANSAEDMIFELLEFNKAIAEAVEFARTRPDETVIIITADHETGGLSHESISPGRVPFDISERIGRVDAAFEKAVEGLFWHTDWHSDQDVPVYASGNGAELFAGQYDNTDIAWKIRALMP